MRRHRRLFGVAFLLVCYALIGLVLGTLNPAVSLNLLVLGVLGCVYFYLRAHRPPPPQNVRLHFPDGRTIPVECVYGGHEGGMHVWTVVTPEAIRLDGLRDMPLRISADVLPARTVIRFPVVPH